MADDKDSGKGRRQRVRIHPLKFRKWMIEAVNEANKLDVDEPKLKIPRQAHELLSSEGGMPPGGARTETSPSGSRKELSENSRRIGELMAEGLNWASENPAMADWLAAPQNHPLTPEDHEAALAYYREHGEPPPYRTREEIQAALEHKRIHGQLPAYRPPQK